MTDNNSSAAGKLSLVLPAFNEAENLPVVIERAVEILPRHFNQFEMVIVNDGSRDATGAVADSLAAEHNQITVVHHPRNRGYGGALVSGFAASDGDYVMFMDADRQFDIEDIDRLTPFIDTHDIVAGFRMERNDPFHRRVFAEIFNVTIRVLFGVHMRDIDCAFKIFQGDLLRSIELTTSGALINTEIQAKARRQGATVQQVGVRHFPRVAGSSTGGNPRIILRAMRDTPRLWWHMRSYEPPAGRPNSRGRHRIGDAAIVAGIGSAMAGIAAIIRRK
jgi:glycosyltransferase involved in cell wall biosynthesis